MTESQVMDLTVVAESFPPVPQPEIARDNILDTIDGLFADGTSVVLVEGIEGIGKTTLLSQFVRRYPVQALSLFIRPASRWAYDPESLQFDLCNQLWWTLHKEELVSTEGVNSGFLGSRLMDLGARARRSNETYYFVIDGLQDIPKGEEHNREILLDMLPFHIARFRFLITGKADVILANGRTKIPYKSLPLSGFTPHETAQFLGDLNLSPDNVDEMYHLCKRNPGQLASMRRILQSGMTIDDLLDELPSKQPNLFEIEWNALDPEMPAQKLLLAILSYDSRSHTLDELARLLDTTADVVRDMLQSLGFITIKNDGEVVFISETWRKFASNRLKDKRRAVRDLFIADLLKEPTSDAARTYLPGDLEEAGRPEDVLTYLSVDNFSGMLDHRRTLAPVQQKAELGMRIAHQQRHDGDMLRFSMHRSSLAELHGNEIWSSEIAARLSQNDSETALVLAQSPLLKEDQLHLLAVIGRSKKERGEPIEPELLGKIRSLYEQIECSAIVERAVQIASDLIYSTPDLAFDMVEKAHTSDRGDNALELAFAALSIEAINAESAQADADGLTDSAQAHIANPELRSFLSAITLMVKGYPAAQIIAETEKLQSGSNQLLFLRTWAQINAHRDDAPEVVEYALKLAIRTTQYSPNAQMFRELATPLPFVRDVTKLKDLVILLDGQKSTIEKRGPTEEYIGIQMLLAEAESRYDKDAACSRLADAHQEILTFDDLAVKSSCLAQLAAALTVIDPNMEFEAKGGIHALTEESLERDVKQLLEKTANHYEATRGVIQALARIKPDMALKWAKALNLEDRKDQALLDIVQQSLLAPDDALNLSFLQKLLEEFTSQDVQAIAILLIMERLISVEIGSGLVVKDALPLLNRIHSVQDAAERCRASCLAYGFLQEQTPGAYDNLKASFLNEISSSWEAIDIGWQRIDSGFRIAEALTRYSRELGKEYLNLTEDFRKGLSLTAPTTATSYIASVLLSIRAYSGLLRKHIDTDDDLDRLSDVIERIPSCGERAALWAEIALRSYAKGREDICKKIVDQHVKPLISSIPDKDTRYKIGVQIAVAPALYCAHPSSALGIISKLPGPPQLYRDEAYAQICRFILTKRTRTDPYDGTLNDPYEISHTEILDICDLLDLMDRDWTICSYMEAIVSSIVSRHHHKSFTYQEKAEITGRLQKIADRLPNKRHIKHDGFKIVAQAQMARLSQANIEAWLKIAEQARQIPNHADSALVLTLIASAMQSKFVKHREALVDEAKELTKQIPSDIDRIEHYEALARSSAEISPLLAKEFVKAAWDLCLAGYSPGVENSQRRVMDLAYKIDSSLAESLASLLDDDPARATSKRIIERQGQIQELKALMMGEKPKNGSKAIARATYPVAAAAMLGALNAGKVPTVSLEHSRKYISQASKYPTREAHPLHAWLVENAVKAYENKEQARAILRPLFEATIEATELTALIAARASGQLEESIHHASAATSEDETVIRAGERDKALKILSDWVRNSAQEYIKLTEPFFGPEDLVVLRLIKEANPDCRVEILTSKKHQTDRHIATPWSAAYKTYWRMHISDQSAPQTDIVIVGIASSGDSPVHDRWWLTKGGGLRLGTSFNSLGISKLSDISVLSESAAYEREQEVDQYLKRTTREYNGEKLDYELFTM